MEPWIIVILCLLQIFSAKADYRLEVRAHTYSNPRNLDSDGLCCDSCVYCDPKFVFCLRPFGTSRDSNPSYCPLGSFAPLDVFENNRRSISFPSSFNFPFTRPGSWPGGFQLLVEIEDEDDQIIIINSNDHIDDIYAEEMMTAGQSITQRAYRGAFSIATMTLSISLTCTSGFGPNCDAHQCPPLSAPDNGEVQQPSQIATGVTATYSCDTGYVLAGAVSRTCQSTGVWTGDPPTCQADLCQPLTDPSNGMVQQPSFIVEGSVATYSCNTGYEVIGAATLTCQSTGAWSGSPPICQSPSGPVCQPLTNPANGIVHQLSRSTEGSIAIYSCNTGYHLVGLATRICLSTETWSGDPPMCVNSNINAQCPHLSSPANGAIVYSSNTIVEDTFVTYSCNAGYELVPPGVTLRVCQSTGAWSADAPTCLELSETTINTSPSPEAPTSSSQLINYIVIVLVVVIVIIVSVLIGLAIRKILKRKKNKKTIKQNHNSPTIQSEHVYDYEDISRYTYSGAPNLPYRPSRHLFVPNPAYNHFIDNDYPQSTASQSSAYTQGDRTGSSRRTQTPGYNRWVETEHPQPRTTQNPLYRDGGSEAEDSNPRTTSNPAYNQRSETQYFGMTQNQANYSQGEMSGLDTSTSRNPTHNRQRETGRSEQPNTNTSKSHNDRQREARRVQAIHTSGVQRMPSMHSETYYSHSQGDGSTDDYYEGSPRANIYTLNESTYTGDRSNQREQHRDHSEEEAIRGTNKTSQSTRSGGNRDQPAAIPRIVTVIDAVDENENENEPTHVPVTDVDRNYYGTHTLWPQGSQDSRTGGSGYESLGRYEHISGYEGINGNPSPRNQHERRRDPSEVEAIRGTNTTHALRPQVSQDSRTGGSGYESLGRYEHISGYEGINGNPSPRFAAVNNRLPNGKTNEGNVQQRNNSSPD